MRCLRSILGLSWKDRVSNTSILQTTGSYDLITIIRYRRLRWPGHVCRMEDNRLPKQVLYSELPNAPRPIGRPKLRFRDVLKRGRNAFSISSTSWEKLACNNREWKSAIETAKQTSKKSFLEDCERRRAHCRTRRDRPSLMMMLALYNYNGLVAPGLSLYNFWVHFHAVCFCVWLCSVQLFRTPCAPGAPQAIRLLIKIQTWLIFKLSKEAITASIKFIVGLRKLWSISSWAPQHQTFENPCTRPRAGLSCIVIRPLFDSLDKMIYDVTFARAFWRGKQMLVCKQTKSRDFVLIGYFTKVSLGLRVLRSACIKEALTSQRVAVTYGEVRGWGGTISFKDNFASV